MKKSVIFLLFSILFFAVGHPTQAQQSCVTDDFTTGLHDWEIEYGATLTEAGITGTGTGFSIYKSPIGSASTAIVSITTDAPSVEVIVYGLSGSNPIQYLSSPGGVLTFNGVPGDNITVFVHPGSTGYTTTITSVELCATPTPTPNVPTPTPTFVPAPIGTPTEGEIGAMTLATLEMPYVFTPADVLATPSAPGMPGDPAASIGIGDLITDVSFLNRIGSIAATIWIILDNFAGGGVLAIFVIILLAVVVIRWIASFVYNKPINEPLHVSASGDVIGEKDPDTGQKVKSFVRQVKNRPRF